MNKVKKLSKLLVCSIIVVSIGTASPALTSFTNVTASASVSKYPVVKVTIDGNLQTFSQQDAVMINGSTMVPMRAIFETLGATISWNQTTKAVTAIKGTTKIVLAIGQKTATVNGNNVKLSKEAVIVNGSTLVPLRFVSESLGANVSWDPKAYTAIITTANTTTKEPVPTVDSTEAKSEVNESAKGATKKILEEKAMEYKSTKPYTKGFHVALNRDFFPEATPVKVQLKDSTGKIISTIDSNSAKQDKIHGHYILKFPVKSFRAGDTFKIGFVDGHKEVSHLNVYRNHSSKNGWTGKTTLISRNQHLTFKVDSRPIYKEVMEDGEWVTTGKVIGYDVEGSADYPYYMLMEYYKNKTSFVLKDTKGAVIKNQEFEVVHEGKSAKYTSNDQGVFTIDTKSLPSYRFSVHTNGLLSDEQDPKREKEAVAHHDVILDGHPTNEDLNIVYLIYHPLGTKVRSDVNE